MNRREFALSLAAGSLVWATSASASEAQPQDAPMKKWLLFTKSAGYEHSVIKREVDSPSHLGKSIRPVFKARNLELVESKDGRLFERDSIDTFAGIVFFTTGDLTTQGTDRHPPMSAAGKQNLLDTISNGTPFIGLHCASDTFHSSGDGQIDPYIAMVGGEFLSHGEQQVATARIVDPSFPGIGTQQEWVLKEEWYVLKNFATDIKPIHILETAGMKGDMYQREPFPLTWTRMHGKGRVFYTGLAHREDVVESKTFLNLIGGAIDWCQSA